MISSRTLLIACGAIAHELVALKKLNQWDMDIQCLPAELHNRPQLITPKVEEMLQKLRASYEHCYLAYADCGTGGKLDQLLEKYNIERLPGAHCYEFFTGSQAFKVISEAEPATFYVTDFLVKHFDRIILGDLGIEKHPELLELYFGNYKKLLFIDQSGRPELQELAESAAQRLGLEYEYRYTGLDHFETPIKMFFEKTAVSTDENRNPSRGPI